jgi:hypothetical protein
MWARLSGKGLAVWTVGGARGVWCARRAGL